ncbi:hypothetical protein GCM10018790_78880 [Kitasatospora xanthocidica]|uniref:hypothetical protein n=1 Tax=Kitasatospora xanthocidica TaxID=83382 RepID=UPI001676BD26|nr:hypothetical protein [Kitasatospora xanthocidica]GHF89843.1 hypothetical protein GCM10018790_78880 [Kitasatospora xanthocidica]
MIEQGADDGEVTYEQVTVVSLTSCEPVSGRPSPGRPSADRPALGGPAPVGPARFAVRVVREAMTVKRVAGYWVRWDECRDEEVRHHARWVADEEYVRPDSGSLDGTLAVTVAAYWTDGARVFSRRPSTETAVVFRPGETEHELVLEQAAPHRPAALSVQLAHARWLGGDGQPIHYGYSGATEAEGGEGEWLVRHPECGTGLLPYAGQAEAG